MKDYVLHILEEGELYDEEVCIFTNTKEGRKHCKEKLESFIENLLEKKFEEFDNFEDFNNYFYYTNFEMLVEEIDDDYDGYETGVTVYENSLDIDTSEMFERYKDAEEYRRDPYSYYGVSRNDFF